MFLRLPIFTAASLVIFVASGRAESPPAVTPGHASEMKAGVELFKSDIGTILRRHCLACHGGEAIKGDFDLSSREALLKSGYVDVGKALDSHLLAVIKHETAPFMPEGKDKLDDATIMKIAKWIDLGAPYDRPLVDSAAKPVGASAITEAERNFWSFRRLKPIVPPMITDPWIRTPIDRFILDKLAAKGIRPNPITDRRHLIRRAYFDLIGLPPTPDEVDRFVNSPDPLAYEKLIDHLLESPHYGERWARHWMDLARFGESHGYEQDTDRLNAFHYRDFLIKAFNQNMPYDQFVRWQIAGDELKPNEPLAMMATGFLGAGVFPTQLTEKEFESSRYDELDDMVATLGTTFLGLSVGCARCHAHKFDPIPALDYYRMAANFTTTIRSEVELDLEPELNRKRQAEYLADLSRAREALSWYETHELAESAHKLLEQYRTNDDPLEAWDEFESPQVKLGSRTKVVRGSERSWIAPAPSPNYESITFIAKPGTKKIQSIRLEALLDKSLPRNGPGRGRDGNFLVAELRVRVVGKDGKAKAPLKLDNGRISNSSDDAWKIGLVTDNDRATGWLVSGEAIGKNQCAVFDLAKPVELQPEDKLQIELIPGATADFGSIGRFRLSSSNRLGLEPAIGTSGLNDAVRLVLDKLAELNEAALREILATGKDGPETRAFETSRNWFSDRIPQYARLFNEVDRLEDKETGVELTKVMVSSEGLPKMPHLADGRGFPHFYPETYYLNRGDVSQKREKVEAGFLRVLMPTNKSEEHWSISKPEGWTRTSYRRAALAHWLTDVDDGAGHLAARVIVNRLWQHHFGVGIVPTAGDFGKQGDKPSHPELLDWLALNLVQNGWELKRVHRLMMTSAVYMQSSEVNTSEKVESRLVADRENKLLWRFTPRRLEGEAIRDSLLFVAGKLDTRMFGPGSLDSNMTRRSIYFRIKRSQLIPMMVLFDWPEHQVSIGTRSQTTIAPQALAFMNSPQCRDWAEAFAKRVATDSVGKSIELAYQYAFGRKPTEQELAIAIGFLGTQDSPNIFEENGDKEKNLKGSALVDLCQAIMSMNEFVYVE